jgi:hypothetical protein
LKEEKRVKGKTVDNCWANQNEIIPENPAEGFMKFFVASQKRGVLTEDEVRWLFASPGAHGHAYVGNLLAMSTGLRAGELLLSGCVISKKTDYACGTHGMTRTSSKGPRPGRNGRCRSCPRFAQPAGWTG